MIYITKFGYQILSPFCNRHRHMCARSNISWRRSMSIYTGGKGGSGRMGASDHPPSFSPFLHLYLPSSLCVCALGRPKASGCSYHKRGKGHMNKHKCATNNLRTQGKKNTFHPFVCLRSMWHVIRFSSIMLDNKHILYDLITPLYSLQGQCFVKSRSNDI